MNIFILDSDPVKAAIHQHNRHVVKMILESAQMLSTTRHLLGDYTVSLYKPAFQNHPCTKWVRESLSNYHWLLRHFKALCEEYVYRYYKFHKSSGLMAIFSEELPQLLDIGLTPFATAMPDEYKVDCNPVQSYRNYYLGKKVEGNFWTNRSLSDLDPWLTSQLNPTQFKRNPHVIP